MHGRYSRPRYTASKKSPACAGESVRRAMDGQLQIAKRETGAELGIGLVAVGPQ